MARDLGECKHARCSNRAVQVVMLEGTNRETGQREVIEQPVCAEHLRDFQHVCATDGCGNLAMQPVHMRGISAETKEPVKSEFYLCDDCTERLTMEPTVTINGITMVHDGQLHFKRLARDIGRG